MNSIIHLRITHYKSILRVFYMIYIYYLCSIDMFIIARLIRKSNSYNCKEIVYFSSNYKCIYCAVIIVEKGKYSKVLNCPYGFMKVGS